MNIFSSKIILVVLIAVLTAAAIMSSHIKRINRHAAIIEKAEGRIFYIDNEIKLSDAMYFVSGRLYLPFESLARETEGAYTKEGEKIKIASNNSLIAVNTKTGEGLAHKIQIINDKIYVSVYDFTEIFSLAPVFIGAENKILLYKKEKIKQETARGKSDAYIRLEDIHSEGGSKGAGCDFEFEKIRVIGEYLYSRGQFYSIAWIPFYKNPQSNYENDLTKNFNFYNADFLYTLDYLQGHNGRIIIHGYTHQEGNTESGVGTEFGQKSPFSKREVKERMEKAKETARFFGYPEDAFEFPHYSCTDEQMKIARRLFKCIYQQSPYAKIAGKIEREKNLFWHDTLFIPTPVGYISYSEEPEIMIENIEKTAKTSLVSMFTHPYVDFENIEIYTSDGIRKYKYSENGLIPLVVNKITQMGLSLSSIKLE